MTHYIITGTSSGIGKALKTTILERKMGSVHGVSRRPDEVSSNYSHQQVNLSDIEQVKTVDLSCPDPCNSIVLINNAADLGQVGYVGNLDQDAIHAAYNVNVIAPVLLMNRLLEEHADGSKEITILNISSGAGKNAIDGWSVYCSSKAALDMASETMALELKMKKNSVARVFSIAPGLVDTAMQLEIRKADVADFSRIDDFLAYKANNSLIDPYIIADQYIQILNHRDSYPDTIYSLRDLNNRD